MPTFSTEEIDIYPSEFVNECSSSEILELIEELVSADYSDEMIEILEESGKLKSGIHRINSEISLVEREFINNLYKLMNNYMSITKEEEFIIEQLAKRF